MDWHSLFHVGLLLRERPANERERERGGSRDGIQPPRLPSPRSYALAYPLIDRGRLM